MIKEKSCGGIVYRIKNVKVEYLLIKNLNNKWSFPKGHVENDETEVETALREIKEETNATVSIDSNFRMINTYTLINNHIKDVVIFVAKYESGKIKPQRAEIKKAIWMDYKKALLVMSFERDKEIFIEANQYVNNNL